MDPSPSTEETVELDLSPAEGAAGTPVTATVTGCSSEPRGAAPPVVLQWDGVPLADVAGTFDVPEDAPLGPHSVTVTCGSATASADFTVTTAEEPTLTLEPRTGRPGDRVAVIGRDFVCDNDSRLVQLVWDSGPLVADTATDGRGDFRGTVEVPPDAALGGRTVQVSCTEGPLTATATFTVVADATTTAAVTTPVVESPATGPLVIDPPATGPPVDGPLAIEPPAPGFPIWFVVLLVVAAIVAALVYRWWRRRMAPAPMERVQAVAHLGGPPEVIIRETPTPGQRTLAIRLQAHADSGSQTIREVNDDHTRS